MNALLRVCGICAVVGGALLAGGWVLNVRTVTLPGELLIIYAHGFIMLGAMGLYARQAEALGRAGLAGLVLAVLGSAVTTPGAAYYGSLVPELEPQLIAAATKGLGAAVSISGALAFVAGHVLLGVTTARAGLLPRWGGGLLAAGALVLLVGAGARLGQAVGTAGALLHGLGLAGLGLALVKSPPGRSVPAPSASRQV
ncbi:MAG TPA: hypothetical protein VEY88_19300 [Archangium sp.]|nr:hypothetical protein [Myxococcaceae bacterium]HZH78184.1 hypothetical protein [Archangium sp.]